MGIVSRPRSGGRKPLEIPLRKLGDADRALAVLSDSWDQYRAQVEVGYEPVVNRGDRVVEYVARVTAQPPTDELEHLLRDAVHNARSALDNLIFGLGRAEGASQEALRRNAFPVVAEGSWGRARRSQLKELPTDISTRVHHVQPVVQDDGLPGPPHPLLILNELENSDNHRASLSMHVLPSPSGGRSLLTSLDFRVDADQVAQAREILSRPDDIIELDVGPVVDGGVVARFHFPEPLELVPEGPAPLALPLALGAETEAGEFWTPILPLMRNSIRFAREAAVYVAQGGAASPEPYPAGMVYRDPEPPDTVVT